MNTKPQKAGQWLRRIARKVKRNPAALWLLQEALKAVIKEVVKTALDWLPVLWDWLQALLERLPAVWYWFTS